MECHEESYQYQCLVYYYFGWVDYTIFATMLIIAASVGIYLSCRGSRVTTVDEFALGGRQMHALPTSLSLMSTSISAITVLGTPAEFYNYGGMYIWFAVVNPIALVIAAEVFIPVFYRLNVKTTYEYLEMRFNRSVRQLTMILFFVVALIYTGLAIYAPSIALSAVTGMDINLAILSTGCVCIFYTVLGGMRGVILTDVFMSIWMIAGLFAVTIKASRDIGYETIWVKAHESGRAEFFTSSWDMTVRNSLQAVLVGNIIGGNTGAFCSNQAFVQRLISCKSINHARGAAYLAIPSVIAVFTLCMTSGFAMAAYYEQCDPFKAQLLERGDQLMPYLTTWVFDSMPGVAAIYVSGAFAGALSTVSSFISSLANTLVNDLIQNLINKPTEQTLLVWNKGLVVALGLIAIGCSYLTLLLPGGIIELANSLTNMVAGPSFGVFCLGFFIPCADEYAALFGLIIGFGVNVWLYVGRIFTETPTEIARQNAPFPASTDGCQFSNGTEYPTSDVPPSDEFVPNSGLLSFYNVSFFYIGFIGFIITFCSGLLIALVQFGRRKWTLTEQQKDGRLHYFIFDHFLLRWLPSSWRHCLRWGLTNPALQEKETQVEHSSSIETNKSDL